MHRPCEEAFEGEKWICGKRTQEINLKKFNLETNETKSRKKAGEELFSACKGKEVFRCKWKLAHSGWGNMGNGFEASKWRIFSAHVSSFKF